MRRRFIGIAVHPEYVRYRREEGRLAAQLGDTAGAIRAYRHYLALRSDPEPRLRAQADTVRMELALSFAPRASTEIGRSLELLSKRQSRAEPR